MATYALETITAAQAASFGTNDQLTITSGVVTAAFLAVQYKSDPSAGVNLSIDAGAHYISFGAGIYGHSISFSDGSSVFIGNPNAAENLTGGPAGDVFFGGGMYGLFPRNGGQDSFDGGSGNDIIYLGGSGAGSGGNGNDTVYGGDSISGGIGNDYLSVYPNTTNVSGGDGDDDIGSWDYNASKPIYIDAGAGNDYIGGVYSTGNDTYIGGSGIDLLYYGSEVDDIIVDINNKGPQQVNALTGFDIIVGFENLTSGDGNDSLRGDSGDNILISIGGDDTLNGEAGNDILGPGDGRSVVIGGAGIDTLSFASGFGADQVNSTTINLATGVTQAFNFYGLPWAPGTVTGVEAVVGSMGQDTIIGSTAAETLSGGYGYDSLASGGGNDQIFGGVGNDTIVASGAYSTYLRGEDGDDTVFGGSGFDDINGNKGNDTAAGGAGADWVVGGQGNDLLYGGSTVAGDASDGSNDIVYGNIGNDTCYGGAGNDTVRGGQNDDVIYGEAGNDWLSGDRGNDTMTGGAGADTFHTFSGAGIDRVLDFSLAQGDRVQLDPGTSYTLSQVGSDAVINMGNGDQMILVGVTASSLTGSWIFTG